MTPDSKSGKSETEKILETTGNKKIRSFLLDLFKDRDFLRKVIDIRKKFGIPINGIDRKSPIYSKEIKLKQYINKRIKIHKEIESLCMEYCLDYMWFDMVEIFVIDNDTNGASWGTICQFYDVLEEKLDPYEKRTQQIINNAFPVAIRISPYASQRDIIDYVKKMYSDYIKPRQESYKKDIVKIGKVKSKKESIQRRNDFIFENRELPKKEIMKLVADKFGEFIDYAHIAKIIYLRKRK